MLVSGPGADTLFAQESGGHRWQRVSPTEKHGRIHTSTITVAVLFPEAPAHGAVNNDIDIITTRGGGPGGQHRNKNETTVVAIHRPTQTRVRINERSQHRNKQQAVHELKERVNGRIAAKNHATRNDKRRRQIGSGMRGDKIRTYRERDNVVIDHRTNTKCRLSDWRAGNW